MGVSLSQYRITIGLYNNVKITTTALNDCFSSLLVLMQLLLLLFAINLLLLLSGDIELNPGPTVPSNSSAGLKISHSNIRGLREKIDAVKNTLIGEFDIIAITESRLTNTFTDESKLHFNGYYPVKNFRRDRTLNTGGGIVVFISEALGATRRYDLEHPDKEMMFIEVRSKNNVFLLCVYYRPPDAPVQFWDDFQTQIDMCKQDKISKLLITGDLNADPLSDNGPHLLQFALQNHLSIHIDEPTRITDTTATILDQFVSNMSDLIQYTEVLPPVSSSQSTTDHCTITACLNFKTGKQKCFTRHIWDYKNADFSSFRSALLSNDWNKCFASDSIDEITELWSNNLLILLGNIFQTEMRIYVHMINPIIPVSLDPKKGNLIGFTVKQNIMDRVMTGPNLEKCVTNIIMI